MPDMATTRTVGSTRRTAAMARLPPGGGIWTSMTATSARNRWTNAAAAEASSVVPEALLRQLLEEATPSGEQSIADQLTADERRLWRLIAEGTSTVDIATTLHVSERTTKRLVANLLRQLKVGTRVEAAALAGRIGLDPEEPARSAAQWSRG